MPLNYSKWDNLELSDDSDIEVHPNIDKKSFIRWKQRDIHEKRDQRKAEKDAIKAEIDTTTALSPRLDELVENTKNQGSSYYSREVARLSAGRQERGSKDGPNGPTTDDMILSLLLQIQQQDHVKGKGGNELDQVLLKELQGHKEKLGARKTQIQFELEQMEKEDSKKITSDSIREGWNSGYVAKAECEPEPKPKPKSSAAKGKKKAETVIETLNSPSASGSTSAKPSSGNESNDEEEDEIPEADDVMRRFAQLPSCVPSSIPLSASNLPGNFDPAKSLNISAFETALQFLSKHKFLLNPNNGTTDSLLLEAFNAQIATNSSLARQCVEKALMIQYCNKLGPDGVNLFFRRMVGSKDGRASVVYLDDVLATYSRIRDRSKALSEQQSASGEEQIQLVAEDENTIIGFEIPDGPPPDVIELEGEAKEKLDPEQVKAWLQNRWDIFSSFPEEFRQALETKQLNKVNEVLGKMKVDDAEAIVGQLDQAGILNFSSSEVRDETGR
ncbi:related to Hsp90 co-chaperone Cdc37 [Melanopsichium pennsylvanicum]|uniref:Hsp90 chaperone protein kinase-targeting subunit n=2 Tax=Melanopsichium pennsylvanicum TaxID=63383 RepID=A0AAJ5C7A6_9BASI|nr:related to Hsp90 co-chaperone Cdc37 [Melanopsichium pennsylvanicum 4]SNX86716.1 related to Hsp90 co-chaperone Cdc37 [Melanopsichium pennsylvanicum]